ncbi:MAG: DUF4268 domain-containing protein [Alphaproteobacteria bacterium]|nr:MAG: DUF4268 domain-containing protein [Alphaproteobacteria bacterium]
MSEALNLTSSINLGKLVVHNPRDVWAHEEHTFTPWLLDNLELIGKEIGIDIDQVDRQREVYVGNYMVDIVAKEVGTNRTIIIENQLGNSDHDHFGKLLTYAGGLDGVIMIWVCNALREEHRRALDWLNSKMPNGPWFFAIEVETIRIDDSRPAVRFFPVVKPQNMVSTPIDPSELRFKPFFQGLVDIMREKHRFTNARVAFEQRWHSFSSGYTDIKYSTVFVGNELFRCELYIGTNRNEANKAIFDHLVSYKNEIETKFGQVLEWDRGGERSYCRIAVNTPGKIDDVGQHKSMQEWAAKHLVRLKEVFTPYLVEIVEEARARS